MNNDLDFNDSILVDGNWHHYVFIRKDGKESRYLDGVEYTVPRDKETDQS